jgi:prepilin signal peptidase PulO-like enzyme (type II secretory pathway)
MEVLTGCLFVYVYFASASLVEIAIGLLLMGTLIVVAVYDMDHMVIPHEFVFFLVGVALVVLAHASGFVLDLQVLLTHAISACAAFLFYGGLWRFSKGKWIGLGDAKLAFPLALMLSPTGAFSMIVLSFWVGAVISIALLFVQKIRRSGKHHLPIFGTPLTMKSEVPFAPFMIAAFILVYFQHINVLSVMASLF